MSDSLTSPVGLQYTASATLSLNDWNWIVATLSATERVKDDAVARACATAKTHILMQIMPVIEEWQMDTGETF